MGTGADIALDPTTTRLDAAAESVTAARHFARDAATGLPADVGQRLELVVSELASNAVRHARTSFLLSILVEPTVRVEVADGSSALPAPRTPDPWRADGRGLLLVAACARSWGVSPLGAGKVVWADLGPTR